MYTSPALRAVQEIFVWEAGWRVTPSSANAASNCTVGLMDRLYPAEGFASLQASANQECPNHLLKQEWEKPRHTPVPYLPYRFLLLPRSRSGLNRQHCWQVVRTCHGLQTIHPLVLLDAPAGSWGANGFGPVPSLAGCGCLFPLELGTLFIY